MTPNDPPYDHADVLRRFSYDPDTGIIRRIQLTRSYYKSVGYLRNAEAGYVKRGYRWIGHRRRQVMASRLAWFMHYGRWPIGLIDHADGNRLNNRITNLREATKAQNIWNSTGRRDSTTGVRGVTIDGQAVSKRYKVMLGNDWLGHFATLEEAAEARARAAKAKYGEFYKA